MPCVSCTTDVPVQCTVAESVDAFPRPHVQCVCAKCWCPVYNESLSLKTLCQSSAVHWVLQQANWGENQCAAYIEKTWKNCHTVFTLTNSVLYLGSTVHVVHMGRLRRTTSFDHVPPKTNMQAVEKVDLEMFCPLELKSALLTNEARWWEKQDGQEEVLFKLGFVTPRGGHSYLLSFLKRFRHHQGG